MRIAFHVKLSEISAHITPAQRGLLVAWASEIPHFYSVEVFASALTINLSVPDGGKFTSEGEILDHLRALLALDPLPCPCGCGAYLVLTNCYKQSEELLTWVGQLTPEEHKEISQGAHILAIKLIRQRLGIGLKEAKDMADYHRLHHCPEAYAAYEAQWGRAHRHPAPMMSEPSQPQTQQGSLIPGLSK